MKSMWAVAAMIAAVTGSAAQAAEITTIPLLTISADSPITLEARTLSGPAGYSVAFDAFSSTGEAVTFTLEGSYRVYITGCVDSPFPPPGNCLTRPVPRTQTFTATSGGTSGSFYQRVDYQAFGGTVANLAFRTASTAPISLRNVVITDLRGVFALPEPATWGLMVLGFGVVGAATRRRPVRVTYA